MKVSQKILTEIQKELSTIRATAQALDDQAARLEKRLAEPVFTGSKIHLSDKERSTLLIKRNSVILKNQKA